MQLKSIYFNSKNDFSTGYLVEYNVYLFFTVFLLLSPRGCYIWSKGRSQLIFQRLPITDQTDTINWTASRPHLTKIFSHFCGLCLAISWPTIETATTASSLTSAGIVLERSWSTIKPVYVFYYSLPRSLSYQAAGQQLDVLRLFLVLTSAVFVPSKKLSNNQMCYEYFVTELNYFLQIKREQYNFWKRLFSYALVILFHISQWANK